MTGQIVYPSHGKHSYDAYDGLYDYGHLDDGHHHYGMPVQYKCSGSRKWYGSAPHGNYVGIEACLAVASGSQDGYHAHHLKQ